MQERQRLSQMPLGIIVLLGILAVPILILIIIGIVVGIILSPILLFVWAYHRRSSQNQPAPRFNPQEIQQAVDESKLLDDAQQDKKFKKIDIKEQTLEQAYKEDILARNPEENGKIVPAWQQHLHENLFAYIERFIGNEYLALTGDLTIYERIGIDNCVITLEPPRIPVKAGKATYDWLELRKQIKLDYQDENKKLKLQDCRFQDPCTGMFVYLSNIQPHPEGTELLERIDDLKDAGNEQGGKAAGSAIKPYHPGNHRNQRQLGRVHQSGIAGQKRLNLQSIIYKFKKDQEAELNLIQQYKDTLKKQHPRIAEFKENGFETIERAIIQWQSNDENHLTEWGRSFLEKEHQDYDTIDQEVTRKKEELTAWNEKHKKVIERWRIRQLDCVANRSCEFKEPDEAYQNIETLVWFRRASLSIKNNIKT